MQPVRLSTKALMPITGFGTWRLREPELTPAIKEAISAGYRHFDGAAIYENEAELGSCFAQIIPAHLAREDLFITSKLWVTKMRPELVEGAVRKSLADWKLDYFDLYLIHWPFAFKANASGSTLYDDNGRAVLAEDVQIQDTWRAMERLVELGLVRSIGVSNYSVRLLQELLSMPGIKIRPAVNQVELHPYLPQLELRNFCRKEGIVVEAYSSLGSGSEPSLLEDATILDVAKTENISPSSVLLSWARQQSIPVIPKSSNSVRVRENIRAHKLSEESMARINGISRRHKYVDPMDFWKHSIPE